MFKNFIECQANFSWDYTKFTNNTGFFTFSDILIKNVDLNDNDTLFGYLTPATDLNFSFSDFLYCGFKKRVEDYPKGTYFIQRVYQSTESVFQYEVPFPQILSTEPVLIDADYSDNKQCSQICLVNCKQFKGDLQLKPITFKLEIVEPILQLQNFPDGTKTHYTDWIYGTPLLKAFQPEDVEEFFNTCYFAQYLVTDFVLVKATKDAAGFDILIREIINNKKDFRNQNEYEDAIVNSLKVPATYQIDLIFPKFFRHWGEFMDIKSLIMLRSSISKHGLSIIFNHLNDNTDNDNTAALKISIVNNNAFDVWLTNDKDKLKQPNAFKFRIIQFVPSAAMLSHMCKLSSEDDVAKFLGVITIFNDETRKSKV